jgi:hypothetical protein
MLNMAMDGKLKEEVETSRTMLTTEERPGPGGGRWTAEPAPRPPERNQTEDLEQR